jgi:hypothetical protein
MIDYPADFIKEVKTAFPFHEALHKALDSGNGSMVGHYLAVHTHFSCTPDELIIDSEKVIERAGSVIYYRYLLGRWREYYSG